MEAVETKFHEAIIGFTVSIKEGITNNRFSLEVSAFTGKNGYQESFALLKESQIKLEKIKEILYKTFHCITCAPQNEDEETATADQK